MSVQTDIAEYFYYCEALYELGFGYAYQFSSYGYLSNPYAYVDYYGYINAPAFYQYEGWVFYYPGYSVVLVYGNGYQTFYYGAYLGGVEYYFWAGYVNAYYADYYGLLEYTDWEGGFYTVYGDDAFGMGSEGNYWFNKYYYGGAASAFVDYEGYYGVFYGDYDSLEYLYHDYYWLAWGAIGYCYTWWWWGEETPYDVSFDGVFTGYYDGGDMYYVAYYTVDVDMNTWEYANFYITYGEIKYEFMFYGITMHGSEYYDDLTVAGEYAYEFWYLTYNGTHNPSYAFGYVENSFEFTGYGFIHLTDIFVNIESEVEYGYFYYNGALISGAEVDFYTWYYNAGLDLYFFNEKIDNFSPVSGW